MPAPTDFTFQIVKANSVRISWQGRHVVTVAGTRATKLIAQLETADDEKTQMLLAKITGNFKRGNERGH